MKFHGIDMRGKFHVQRVSTLPVFESTDKGRIIYVEDEDEFYFGGTTEWKQGGVWPAPEPDPSFVGLIGVFSKLPPGDTWLPCNGQTIFATQYPELVEFLAGEGALSAQLPDYRGYFLRGWDMMGGTAAEVDPGRSLGSVQEDMIKRHTGTTEESGAHSHTGTTSTTGAHGHSLTLGTDESDVGPKARGGGNTATSGYATSFTGGDHNHNITTNTAGAHKHTFTVGFAADIETRPKNISVIYAIRVK